MHPTVVDGLGARAAPRTRLIYVISSASGGGIAPAVRPELAQGLAMVEGRFTAQVISVHIGRGRQVRLSCVTFTLREP